MEINSWNKLDFIGDIHANSKKLLALIEKLGYCKTPNSWKHPENRQLVILGDFINVGINNKQTLSILHNLWKNNIALIILGNHEYFLSLYYFKFGKNIFTSPKSTLLKDYESLLFEFKNSIGELCEYLDWFMKLPFYIENDKFRAVHAYWSNENIEELKHFENLFQLFNYLKISNTKEKRLKNIVNETIEGIKLQLFISSISNKPIKYRIKWWQNIYSKPLPLCIMTHKPVKCPGVIVTPELLPNFRNYLDTEKPVFFGHYWFQTLPYLLKNNACCLDFGASKGGYLAAYRWNGEKELNAENLIYV